MNLSKNFTLDEFTHSDTAIKKGIKNIPDEISLKNLQLLVSEVLQPLRDKLGVSININSGYRSPQLNLIIGGVSNSQHMLGQAADTTATGITIDEYFNSIKQLVINNELEVDQVIKERGRKLDAETDDWVHVSYRKGNNRNQFLERIIDKGKYKYITV